MAGGVCMVWQIQWDTVNERVLRILLECILVDNDCFLYHKSQSSIHLRCCLICCVISYIFILILTKSSKNQIL